MLLLLDAGWWSLAYGAALWLMASTRLADALYQGLDARGISPAVPWLVVWAISLGVEAVAGVRRERRGGNS